MIKVLGLGDSLMDRYLYAGMKYPGGNAYNFAVKAKQYGADAAFMGKIANDADKENILRPLIELGIDISHCQYEDGENGYTEITLTDGERTIDPGNYGGIVTKSPLAFSEDDIAYMKTFQFVHTSIYSGLDEQIPHLAEKGVRFTYDFSSDFTQEQMKLLCPHLAYGLFSAEDIESARGIAKYAKKLGIGCAVATAGNAGAVVCSDIGYTEAPGLKLAAPVVDTMACGDSFITGFLIANEISENLYYANIDNDREYEEPSLDAASYETYVQAALTNSIYQGHLLAAKNCMVKGGVGFGVQL